MIIPRGIHKTGKRRLMALYAALVVVASLMLSFKKKPAVTDPMSYPGLIKNHMTNVQDTEQDQVNWPFFRGWDSRGIAFGSGYPVNWNGETGENIEWKAEVPGKGKSSPVIWGDRIFLTGARGNECEVYCFNKKNGSIIWTGSASGIPGQPDSIPRSDPEAGMAVPSAATDGQGVFAIFGNGNLICFDMDGNRKWSKNIGLPANTYGYSSSLLIYDKTLIVQFDSQTKISLEGFDTGTGEQKWETIRKGLPVWSSPVLAYFGGQPQVIINGNPGVSSFEAVTGKELWTINCLTGDVAPSAAVNSEMVFSVTDFAMLSAIKGGMTPSVVWKDNSYTPDASSPTANDKYLFLTTGAGDMVCYNPDTGDTLWTRYIMDQFYASPVIADGKVYMLDRQGVMHIVREDSKFELLAESPLGENSDCTPAFSGKKIYIRGKKHLYCISK